MLLAGEDTTANTLAWAVWLLTRNPEALARARAEVDANSDAAAGWTLERLAELRYVEACANETMRLKPVAPFLMLQALRETRIADIRVPAGTLVWAGLRTDTLREDYFENATSFSPERWLDAHAAPSTTSVNRIAMPFGAGLLGTFDIESVTPVAGTEPDELMSFAMTPAPMSMRLRERALPATP